MLKLRPLPSFEKDIKQAVKKHRPMEKPDKILDVLEMDEPLNVRFHDHSLTGDWAGFRELHIEQKFLLIYRIVGDKLHLVRFGSHDDLFK